MQETIKEPQLNKTYYSIGEVASMLNVNASLIRFWEKEFKILKPQKNKKGDRFFSIEDIEKLKAIFYYVKECGYTLNGAKEKLKQVSIEDEIDKNNQIESLNKIKKLLIEIRSNL